MDEPAIPQIPDLQEKVEPPHSENHHMIEIELAGVYLQQWNYCTLIDKANGKRYNDIIREADSDNYLMISKMQRSRA